MNLDVVIRIMLVDDHPMMRAGIRASLNDEPDMKVVVELADGQDAIEAFPKYTPDLVVMDLQMPRTDGIQAIKCIHEMAPQTPIVVLTTYSGDARVNRALSSGATSYLLKTASSREITDTLRAAFLGRRHVTSEVLDDVHGHHGEEQLNARELSVLELASQGLSNREIGVYLRVAEETIKSRMKAILAKLNANDRTHAVRIAIRRGFLN